VEAGGRTVRQEYSGRVGGDAIAGKVRFDGGEHEWRATRVKRGSIDMNG